MGSGGKKPDLPPCVKGGAPRARGVMGRPIDQSGHRDYDPSWMRSVGIKALKAHLSRYIDLVKKGEVVLVTDRDEVVAEIRLPSQLAPSNVSRWDLALQEEARRGSVVLAKNKQSRLPASAAPASDSDESQEILAELREDRF
jgi:antitoxin (DNA-binding transcriptional repressor) of toxin-antitoxin stability system